MRSYCEREQIKPLPIPTVPPEHRWCYLDHAIVTHYGAREPLRQALLDRPEYGLEPLTEVEWTIVSQVGSITAHFSPIMSWMEGEKYVTSADFLGKLLERLFLLFYSNRAQDSRLHPSVQALKNQLRDEMGTRLHNMESDVLLAALGVHPFFRLISPPTQGLVEHWYTENESKNILTFYFRNLRDRMKTAMKNIADRLKLVVEAPPPVANMNDDPKQVISFFFAGHFLHRL
jgi:hypothetical protein